MAVTLETLAELSREVVQEQARQLEVVAVTKTEGDTARAEVLVTVHGCHRDPCMIMINVSRADGDEFARDFRAKLRDAMRKHSGDA